MSRDIFGIPIVAAFLTKIPQIITSSIESEGKKTFFYVNAHCLNIASKDNEYKSILQKASLVYSGGIGPVLASRILGQPLPQRTPTPDFIDKVFSTVHKKKWSVYLLGTKEKSLKLFTDQLKQKFPNIDIRGSHHGYFTKNEEAGIINSINLLKPTILIVGMGSPKQEKWIDDNLERIDAKAFWAIGALFDVMAGVLPRAPKWMQAIGLEWLFRFFQEPRRLWKRYFIGNIMFLAMIFTSALSRPNKLISSYRNSNTSIA